jgi:hypothetical protein
VVRLLSTSQGAWRAAIGPRYHQRKLRQKAVVTASHGYRAVPRIGAVVKLNGPEVDRHPTPPAFYLAEVTTPRCFRWRQPQSRGQLEARPGSGDLL